MRAQIKNQITKAKEEAENLRKTLRTAELKYLELNHAYGQLINSAVPKLRGYRLRLYLSVALNVALLITTIYFAMRKP